MALGRPEKTIDWEKVDRLLESQNKGTEIASHFNITKETFYHRVKEKYGVDFSTYSTNFYSKGKSNLRTRQYQKAMEGNVQMLLNLGEVYLGQGEKKSTEGTFFYDRDPTIRQSEGNTSSTQVSVSPIPGSSVESTEVGN